MKRQVEKKHQLSISESQSTQIPGANESEGLILQGKHHVNQIKYFSHFLFC